MHARERPPSCNMFLKTIRYRYDMILLPKNRIQYIIIIIIYIYLEQDIEVLNSHPVGFRRFPRYIAAIFPSFTD